MNKDFTGLQAVGVIAGVIFIVALLVYLLSWFIAELWNYAVVPIFGLPPINMTQALGLFALAKIFFTTTSYSRSSK